MKKERLDLLIPFAEKEKILNASEELHIPMSEIVRELIEKYLEQYSQEKKQYFKKIQQYKNKKSAKSRLS